MAATTVTAKKKRKFLDLLAECGNVSRSASAVGSCRQSMYRARRKDPEFRREWEEAEDIAAIALEDEARRRAFEGVDEPVFYQGEVCGTIKRYSDTLLIFMLKAHNPEKYKDTIRTEHCGMVNVTNMELEELLKLDAGELAKLYSEALKEPSDP